MCVVFDVVIKNRSNESRTVDAFLWAANDKVNPPERGLWPVASVDTCLTDTGELKVSEPKKGERFKLGPKAVVKRTGQSILLPMGWYEGELVRFHTIRLEIWSIDGKRLLCQKRKLDPPPRPKKPVTPGGAG